MKILTTLSYWRPYISGLTICAQRLIDGLAKGDFEFTILTSRYENFLPKKELQGKILILRQTVWFTVGKVPIMPGYLFRLIREITRNDLVWIHLPQAEGLLTAVVAKILGKPVVVTVHCLPLLPSGWQRTLFQKLSDLLNNLIISLADKVIYHTKDYAENTKELLHIPEKSSYIFPPVPLPKITKQNVYSSIVNRQSLVVGFVARLAEDKGFEYLIRALEALDKRKIKTRLLAVGPQKPIGEKRYVSKMRTLLDKTKLNIKFLGTLPAQKMNDFYRSIDILVLPSVNRTEAFGIVQVEAMLRGIPVIASDLPGVRTPIQLTKSGLIIPPMNVEKLADAIIVLAKDITPDFSRKIFLQSKKLFNASQSVRSYQDIFYQQRI